MRSQIETFSYPSGEIQRVHLVRPDRWEDLQFLSPEPASEALDCFFHVYKNFLVPGCPWIFGHLVLFRIPQDMATDFPSDTGKYGSVADPLTAAAAALRKGVRVVGGKPVFRDPKVRNFWNELEARGCLHIVSGKLPVTTIIPVGNLSGYLSKTAPQAAMKVNASFFIMDRFDCATVYDRVGTPLGLCVKDGVVKNPPLFRREALLVRKDGSVRISCPDISDLTIEINGTSLLCGKNARVYSRPCQSFTPPRPGMKLVIIGDRVAAVSHKLSVPVPASGFVLCPQTPCSVQPGDPVIYRGMEDVQFGIQVGNSIVRDGVPTRSFLSRFYNLRGLDPVPFPPSLYPLDFDKARAARIALGADRDGNPMILWAEGAGKLHYTPGQDSCGASLSEMAHICSSLGMHNAINLDGGGSAQLLLNNRRSLLISDRNTADNSEAERPVPLGLMLP